MDVKHCAKQNEKDKCLYQNGISLIPNSILCSSCDWHYHRAMIDTAKFRGTDVMTAISIHVLDLENGRSGHQMSVLLEFLSPEGWVEVAKTIIDVMAEKELISEVHLEAGIYRLSTHVKSYLKSLGKRARFPYIPVVFEVVDAELHYEISLLMSDSGYTVNVA